MYKVKQRLTTLLMACFAVLVSMLLAVTLWTPTANIQASAADTLVATFTLGADGSASHSDGSDATAYTETSGSYTLTLSSLSKVYKNARDAKGNSCIKLGTSGNAGKFSFTAPDDIVKVVIYVAKYKTNTSKVTINGSTTTLTKNSNNGEYDAITVDTTSNKTVSLTTVSGGYRAMVNTIEFYSESTCEHVNKTTTETPATCTNAGSSTVTCDDCGKTISSTTIDALGHDEKVETIEATCSNPGKETTTCSRCDLHEEKTITVPHNFENGKCTVCDTKQPAEATLTFDDTQKRTEFTTEKQVWKENGITLTNDKDKSTSNVADYSNPVRLYKSSKITIEYPQMVKIVFTCSKSDYSIQDSIGDSAEVNGTVVTITFAEPVDSYTITLANQVRLNSLTVTADVSEEIPETPAFEGASLTLKEDITLNYYVKGLTEDVAENAVVVFTYNDKTVESEGEKQEDGRYKYSLELAPQFMTVSVNAELKINSEVVNELKGYSIQKYAISQLDNAKSSEELKRLVSDMLYYGAEAQKYVAAKAETTVADDALATAGVENLETPSTATPESTDFTLVKNSDITNYPAYFTGAGVYFDNVNSIYVRLNMVDENVTLTVNGTEVNVEGTTVYTDGIKATAFADTYTFVLSYDGEVMQTLTYSVNAYAYAMEDNAKMGELALALYRYGASAEAYQTSLNA